LPDTTRTEPGILVLATDDLSRRALERALSDHGYEPLLACSVADARTLTDEHTFTLCVIDTHSVCADCAIDLARRLLAENSAASAIIVHDGTTDLTPFDGLSNRIRTLLRPFPMLEFISAVDDALAVKR